MKKLILILTALFVSISAFSQECSTSWPYLYPDFQDGLIYMSGGQTIAHKLNIHVLKGRLHYIDGEMVKEALGKDIIFIEIGKDRYMVVNGDVMKVVGSQEKGFVATHITGDMQKLLETGGAYGSSSTTQATRKLSSIEMAGANQNHMELRQNKDNGQAIDLIYKYYIVTNGQVYEATKRGIESQLSPERKAAFKVFLKNNKIKWKDPESLLTLLDFFNE